MDVTIDSLRISPKHSSNEWKALTQTSPADWTRAVDIVRDRLEGRFLRFADAWISDEFSDFVVLAIDSLLAETIQQFRAGETKGTGGSQKYIEQFLTGPRFQPDFDQDARTRFYKDIRCGLLHQAEAKAMWLVRRGQGTMLHRVEHGVEHGKGYIIDVPRFHAAIRLSLQDYFQELMDPSNDQLRANLWRKMEQICNVRTERGLLYEADTKTTVKSKST